MTAEDASSTQDPRPRPEAPERRAQRSDPDLVAFLSRTAGGLAHEIKNPLSTIAINLALLEEDWQRAAVQRSSETEPPPREKRSLKRIATLKREVSRLEQIVEEFLSFVRGTEVNRRPQDLAAVVRETLEFVAPEDEVLGIRHHADLPVGLPLVLLDEQAFRQALLNLLVNARQAMPGGGELMVRVQRHKSWVELTVTDTGVGMTPEELERCFDVYWSSKKKGTGLGLPAVKRIVEEHQGVLDVVSEPGRGTSFSIWLPLVVEVTGKPRRPLGDVVVDAVVVDPRADTTGAPDDPGAGEHGDGEDA